MAIYLESFGFGIWFCPRSTISEYLQFIRILHRGNLLEVIVSNPIACEGIQFPTDHFNDPFLV